MLGEVSLELSFSCPFGDRIDPKSCLLAVMKFCLKPLEDLCSSVGDRFAEYAFPASTDDPFRFKFPVCVSKDVRLA